VQALNTAAVDSQYLQDVNAHAKDCTSHDNPDIINVFGATLHFHPKKHLNEIEPDVKLTALAAKIAVLEGSQLMYSSRNDDYQACKSTCLVPDVHYCLYASCHTTHSRSHSNVG
jgi:hypothetical protein